MLRRSGACARPRCRFFANLSSKSKCFGGPAVRWLAETLAIFLPQGVQQLVGCGPARFTPSKLGISRKNTSIYLSVVHHHKCGLSSTTTTAVPGSLNPLTRYSNPKPCFSLRRPALSFIRHAPGTLSTYVSQCELRSGYPEPFLHRIHLGVSISISSGVLLKVCRHPPCLCVA